MWFNLTMHYFFLFFLPHYDINLFLSFFFTGVRKPALEFSPQSRGWFKIGEHVLLATTKNKFGFRFKIYITKFSCPFLVLFLFFSRYVGSFLTRTPLKVYVRKAPVLSVWRECVMSVQGGCGCAVGGEQRPIISWLASLFRPRVFYFPEGLISSNALWHTLQTTTRS